MAARVAAVLALAAANVAGAVVCRGRLGIHGVEEPAYVLGGADTPAGGIRRGAGGRVFGGSLTLEHHSGFSIMNSCRDSWSPTEFKQFYLLGRALSFTVDLSRVGCACNLAVYLAQEPARDPGGHPSRGSCASSPYYCDANRVCGQFCPEIDLMEANNRVLQATCHKCSKPRRGHYTECDRGGCGQNTRSIPWAYGHEAGNKIRTTLPFEVSVAFPAWNGTLVSMVTTLRQSGREVTLFSKCDAIYMAQLSEAMRDGMALRITYWGGAASAMGWLDIPPCGPGDVCLGGSAGDATISDLRVEGDSFAEESCARGGQTVEYGGGAAARTVAAVGVGDHMGGGSTPRSAAESLTVLWWVAVTSLAVLSGVLCLRGAWLYRSMRQQQKQGTRGPTRIPGDEASPPRALLGSPGPKWQDHGHGRDKRGSPRAGPPPSRAGAAVDID